jgi:hypothetical protein
MATGTLGTSATNSLTSLIFSGAMNTTDLAAIAQGIKDDLNATHPIWPGAYAQNGLLYVPSRGVLRVFAGDYVGIDSQGWPVLVSANSIANASWTHT